VSQPPCASSPSVPPWPDRPSVCVVAHHADLVAVLGAAPGDVAGDLRLVTSDGVTVDRVGRWTIDAALHGDPRRDWSEAAALPVVAGADVVVFVDGAAPIDGWLAGLLAAFADDPHLGGAQPAVLAADGTLAHAGALVFADGTVAPYGAGARWPDAPPYACRRHVDAFGPACVALRGPWLARVAAEDLTVADPVARSAAVAFALRRLGVRTWFEPAARVVVPRSATSAPTAGASDVLTERYARELREQPSPATGARHLDALAHRPQGGFGPGEVLAHDWLASRVAARHAKRVWMIDPATLTFDRDTGHLRAYRIVEELRAQGHHVLYVADHAEGRDEYVPALSRLGVMSWGADPRLVLGHPLGEELAGVFRPPVGELALRHPADLVWLSFHYLVPRYLPDLRAFLPDTPVVLDTVDVHHVREGREAEVLGRDDLRRQARRTRRQELAACRAVDAVVCVTEDDADVVRRAAPGVDVHLVSVVHDLEDPGPDFDARQGLFFVASFVPTPNGDAMRWYRDEIRPRLDARCDAAGVARIPLTIAGFDPRGEAAALAGPGIEVVGRIPEVLPYLHRARVSIAPLRWGAGVKGKVCEAMAAGLPVVGTSVAFEGLDVVHGEHSLVADDADAFAEAVFRLHEDRALWARVRAAAPGHIDERVGRGRLRRDLAPVLDAGRRLPSRRVHTASTAAGRAGVISVIVHADDDQETLSSCLGNLRLGADRRVEVVVVDDGLIPPVERAVVAAVGGRLVRLEERVGYRAAVEQGIAESTGELLLCMGSEVLLGPRWAESVRRALADPTVGAVGLRTNTGVGWAALDLPAYRTDQDFQARAALVASGGTGGSAGPGALAEVAALDPSGIALRRDTLAALDGRLDLDAGAQPWLGVVRAEGRRLVLADDLVAHRQHRGPARLDVTPLGFEPALPALAAEPLPVTAVVVGRDARLALRHLSASLDGLVAERVWVDTGSRDGSDLLAARLGWRVVDGRGDEPALRNPWVLHLEPQEVAVVRDRAGLRAALAADDVAAYAVAVWGAPGPYRPAALTPWRREARLVRVGRDDGPSPAATAPLAPGLEVVGQRPSPDQAAAARRSAARPLARADALAGAGLHGWALDVALDVLDTPTATGASAADTLRTALRAALDLADDEAVARVAAELERAEPALDADTRAVAAASVALAAGDAASALRRLEPLVRRGPTGPDPSFARVWAPTLAARAELARGRTREAWHRLRRAAVWGDGFPGWGSLLDARPAAVPEAEVVALALAGDGLGGLLDALADRPEAERAHWLQLLLDQLPQPEALAGALLVGASAEDLARLPAADLVAAAADALVRRRARARRRARDLDRPLSILLTADGGPATCLAWLEALVAAGHHDAYELVVVDNGTRDDTAALLACLEGDVEVVRLPVPVRYGHAVVEAVARLRGRTCLLTTTAVPLPDDALATAVRLAHAPPGWWAAPPPAAAVVVPTPLLLAGGALDAAAVDGPALVAAVVAVARAALPDACEAAASGTAAASLLTPHEVPA